MRKRDTWLRRLVEKSSSLEERLGPDFVVSSEEGVDDRWAAWCQRIAGGDARRLTTRLEWDGLDRRTVHRALADVRLKEGVPLPRWVETLHACLLRSDAPTMAPERVYEDGRRYLRPGEPLPFEEALVPFVDEASESRVRKASGIPELSAAARASVERSLLRELSNLCARTLAEEFSFYRMTHAPGAVLAIDRGEPPQGRELYVSFLQELRSGGLEEILEEHPVLARLLAQALDRWGDSIEECLQRLARDLPLLQETLAHGAELSLIAGLDVELSDPHRGGRRVFRLDFASGCSLIYKPRSLGLEAAWSTWVAQCNRAGLTPHLRAAAVLDRATHGWMEYVRAAPCQSEAELEHHHERSGMQLALLYALAGTDYHNENLIAAGAHPVLVDHEMLVSPLLRPLEGAGATPMPMHSVLRTRLLPSPESPDPDHGTETSGLGGLGGVLTGFQRPVWRGINTDGMQLTLEPWRTRVRSNVPSLKGRPHPAAEHLDALLRGFRSMYGFLVEHREEWLAPDGPLEQLRGLPVRVLLRSTQSYGWLLEHLLEPEFLRDGIDRSIELDLLSRAFLRAGQRHAAWPAVQEEAASLDRMDIPRFTGHTDGTEVILESGKRLPKLTVTSGFELARTTLLGLGPEDLERQVQLIRDALS